MHATHTCICTVAHKCMHAHMDTHAFVLHTHACTCIHCVSAHMLKAPAEIHVHTHIPSTQTCVYAHMHTYMSTLTLFLQGQKANASRDNNRICNHKGHLLNIYYVLSPLHALFLLRPYSQLDFPGGLNGKASAYNGGELDSLTGLARSPGEGYGNPLQYSCLGNPMDGGAWWATVHGVAKSGTRLSNFTFFHFTVDYH